MKNFIKEEEKVNVINEINEGQGKELALIESLDLALVEDKQIVNAKPNNDFHCIIGYDKIAAVSTAMTPVGATIGHYVGRQVGIELGDALRKETEKKFQALALEGVKNITNNTLLTRVANNEFGLVGRQVGEKIEETAIDIMTREGEVAGGFIGAVGTVAVLEGVNLLGYMYNNYVQPYVDGYRLSQAKARAEAADAREQAEKDARLLEAKAEKDPELEDFVIVKKSSI